MTSNEITDRLILDNQNLVIEELMRHDESLWEELQNLDENSEIMEWWLVTPYMAELLKEKGEVILSDATGGEDRHRDRHFTWTE